MDEPEDANPEVSNGHIDKPNTIGTCGQPIVDTTEGDLLLSEPNIETVDLEIILLLEDVRIIKTTLQMPIRNDQHIQTQCIWYYKHRKEVSTRQTFDNRESPYHVLAKHKWLKPLQEASKIVRKHTTRDLQQSAPWKSHLMGLGSWVSMEGIPLTGMVGHWECIDEAEDKNDQHSNGQDMKELTSVEFQPKDPMASGTWW
ncbi:hypothetical protein BKA82DRAFT_4015213 [Pisolithus tinctorius]|nr:hypothetical protein BKA82DRAFT_4015213 [Pisolithus tinctorius]